ncbi:MAG: DUF4139 domain-containing protein [Alphaproteobacteria bacterium]|nr:DUF4139 domain-containing protein [Alphaproteobacteria bacterium]
MIRWPSRIAAIAALALALLAPISLCAGPAAAAELQLRRVILSSGGVGYFEFDAAVAGPETLALTVPLDQVDDVLKSLVVTDPSGGAATVRLPGREPLSETFRALPFGQEALASPQALLTALVGAEVRLATAGMSGRILSVTAYEVQLPNGQGRLTRHRLALATPRGLETAVLEEAGSLEFASAELARQVNHALAAIAESRVQDRRRLEIALPGQGSRTVRVGYVVSVPVWKAAYRLTLPADPAQRNARLQGFAVVENLSGQDWRGVEMTLVSGNPVTYRQRLYEAYMLQRPEAPIEVPGRILPRLDQGVVPQAPVVAAAPAPAAPAMAMLGGVAAARSRALTADSASEMAAPGAPPPPPPPAASAETQAQVMFRLAQPVTAAAGQSLMLPIVETTIPAERVALYQPEVNARHPLVAVELANEGGTALPPGIVTLYDLGTDGAATYVGDARLPVTPSGEKRLVSFALDQQTRIDADRSTDTVRGTIRIVRGVMEIATRQRAVTTYRIVTPARGAPTLIVEQARRQGWSVTEPAERDVSLTPTHYRMRRAMQPGQANQFTVVLERPVTERIEILSAGLQRLQAIVAQGDIDPRLRQALQRAADIRATQATHEEAAKRAGARIGAIVADQSRIRDNIGRVPANSELHRRYLSQLQAQENELDRLRTAQADAEQKATAARDALAEFLRNLTL